jgi:hypothetical protein
MPKIFDSDSNEIAEFPLSPKHEQALKAGEEITMLFHTPQLQRSLLGTVSGSFTLRKIGERVVALDPGSVKKYAAIQQGVKKARGLE